MESFHDGNPSSSAASWSYDSPSTAGPYPLAVSSTSGGTVSTGGSDVVVVVDVGVSRGTHRHKITAATVERLRSGFPS